MDCLQTGFAMSSRHPLLTSCVLAFALLAMSASVLAAPRGGGGRGGAAPPTMPVPPRSGHRDSDALSDSVRRIERSTRGQVLSAERVPYDGRDVNRIKTVDERGRVRVYMDDPQAPPPPDRDPPPAD
jgi:hypothetical protein